jgi:hypothetical protein
MYTEICGGKSEGKIARGTSRGTQNIFQVDLKEMRLEGTCKRQMLECTKTITYFDVCVIISFRSKKAYGDVEVEY